MFVTSRRQDYRTWHPHLIKNFHISRPSKLSLIVPRRHMGKRSRALSFLTSTLDEGVWSFNTPSHNISWESPSYPLNWRLGEYHSHSQCSWAEKNLLPLLRTEPPFPLIHYPIISTFSNINFTTCNKKIFTYNLQMFVCPLSECRLPLQCSAASNVSPQMQQSLWQLKVTL